MYSSHPFGYIPSDRLIINQFDVPVPESFKPADNFPYCCDYHKNIYNDAKNFLKVFPDCCDYHREAIKNLKIDKVKFANLPMKVVKQVSYFQSLLETNINNDDWYEDITEYIECNLRSFGQPSVGEHLYINRLKKYLEKPPANVPIYKAKLISNYIESILNPPEANENKENTDLNLLYQIYQKWLKAFPFNNRFFAPYKEYFSKKLPIITGKTMYNRYTGLTKAKLHTYESFIKVLSDLTIKVLNLINTTELLREGKINEIEKTKLELVINEREVRRVKLLENYSNDEKKYIDIISTWLNDEINFFNRLNSVDKKVLPKRANQKPQQTSFKIKYGKNDSIRKILTELNIQIGLIDEEKNNINEFLEVMTTKNFSNMKQIHLSCYLNQFAIIIENLKNYYEKLNYESIGKSKLFISRTGEVVKSGTLSSSKHQNPNVEYLEVIESVFSKFQQIH